MFQNVMLKLLMIEFYLSAIVTCGYSFLGRSDEAFKYLMITILLGIFRIQVDRQTIKLDVNIDRSLLSRSLWIVGKHCEATAEFKERWEFMGVFDSEEAAVEACLTPLHFVGPAVLNERLTEEPIIWPGHYFPLGPVLAESDASPATEVTSPSAEHPETD